MPESTRKLLELPQKVTLSAGLSGPLDYEIGEAVVVSDPTVEDEIRLEGEAVFFEDLDLYR